MTVVCSAIYLIILAVFGVGYWRAGSFHIGLWLYVMLFFYVIGNVYCVGVILREMLRRRRMLETMAASDIMPYVRYSRASVFIVCVSALAIPAAILSTTLLYIIGPIALFALLFFNLTFVALGSNYIPTEELLDKEAENNPPSGTGNIGSGGTEEDSDIQQDPADVNPSQLQIISDERRNFIQQRLDAWCENQGYKDCNANMLTLSRTLCISKNEQSLFFDQCQHSNFRIWLSEIRFRTAKKMMQEYPDYSNDIISAECGFSCRTHLYRIFKTKAGCSPTEWRKSIKKE